jgi:hypothetical protein
MAQPTAGTRLEVTQLLSFAGSRSKGQAAVDWRGDFSGYAFSAKGALAVPTYQMLERESTFIVTKDVLVAALAAHPYTVTNLLVCLEGTQAGVAVLVD